MRLEILFLLFFVVVSCQKNLEFESILKIISKSTEVEGYLKSLNDVKLDDKYDDNGETLLCIAIQMNLIETLKVFISNGFDLNIPNKNGITPLEMASQIVKLLVENKAKINNENGNSLSLFNAMYIYYYFKTLSQNLNTDMFIYLLNNGANPHSTDKNNCTVLWMSTLTNDVKIVRSLLKYKVKNDCIGEDDVTCLMTAAYSGSYDIVLELLKIRINVNSKDITGTSAIFIATQQGHSKIVKLLCDNGADINIQDNDGRTALWQTASKGDKTMLLVLLHLKADPNISHNLSISPLHIALKERHPDIALILIDSMDLNTLNQRDNKNKTALEYAIEYNYIQIIKLLIQKGVDYIPKNKDENSVLEIAAKYGYIEIIKYLLPLYSNNPMLLDSALLTACTYKHKETIKYLIENGAPIQKCLCRAAINGTSQDLLEYFDNYQSYIDIPCIDENDFILFIAIQNHNYDMSRYLINRHIQINTVNQEGFSPLHKSIIYGYDDISLLLIEEKSTNINTQLYTNLSYPLLDAIRLNQFKVVEKLFDRNPTIFALPSYESIICYPLIKQYTQIIDILLNHGVSTEGPCKGYYPLHLSSQYGYYEISLSLIEKGTNVNYQSSDGKNSLHYASASKQHSRIIVDLLLLRGVTINTIDNYGLTAMDYAIINENLHTVSLLYKVGGYCNILIRKYFVKGEDPRLDQHALTAYLLKMNISATFYPILHEFLIKWRHNYWSKQTDNTSHQSIKLLKQSCENGYDFFLEQILQNINIDTILTKENYTALHLASLYGHVNIIKTLLEYGASLSIPPSPICLASKKGHIEIIKFLIRRGASPDIICNEKTNSTPLWNAASYGFADIVKIILPYYNNYKKNLIEISSSTNPLSISCYVGHLNVVKVLIESGISKDGDLNNRPIIIASQEGHADIVKYLLNIGCSPDSKDSNGFTALAIASARQHSDIVSLLKKSIKRTALITSDYNFNSSTTTKVISKLFYDEKVAEKMIHYIICCNLILLIIIIFRCVN